MKGKKRAFTNLQKFVRFELNKALKIAPQENKDSDLPASKGRVGKKLELPLLGPGLA